MLNQTGFRLEAFGQRVFKEMGFTCAHLRTPVRLRVSDPEGECRNDEEVGFNYLIPSKKVCLIGNITALESLDELRQKYLLFCNHFDMISSLEKSQQFRQLFRVPKHLLHKFKDIKGYKGFFIATRVENDDVNLPKVPKIKCFFRKDWEILVNCALCFERYTNHPVVGLYKKNISRQITAF
jgi:hypothetical protein